MGEGCRLRNGLSPAAKSFACLPRPSAREHRPHDARRPIARHRRHGRFDRAPRQGGLMPERFDLRRRLVAEALGTGLLVTAVVGSGIMAETLTRDVALAL